MAATAQLGDGRLRDAAFDHQNAGAGGTRPKRDREMFRMPGRGVDCFLQIHAGMDVAQEELRDPLVLLVAAGRTTSKMWLTVAQRERRRERGTRALTGGKRRRVALLQPEHLRARAKAEAEF